ncbi:MAG: hypothetical protein HY763_06995 [Planctomycetes bacterium]|nr:hypothetical protein [Planctomycetota bacterium]
MKSFFRLPLDDVLASMEPMMRVRRPVVPMLTMVAAMVVTWFLYVPIHELLHVFGCTVFGGTVSELELKPMYGGTLLAQWFPFVKPGGSYAGRLSGFDYRGSDWIYLSTDFMPFVLSVCVGVPLMRLCTRRRRPGLLGPAVVVGLAPFYNIPGDYFEMASIMVTRAATVVSGGGGGPPVLAGIRSDDIFALLDSLIAGPARLGLEGIGTICLAILLIVVSLMLDVLLAFLTYALGGVVARVTVGPPRRVEL